MEELSYIEHDVLLCDYEDAIIKINLLINAIKIMIYYQN